MSKISRKLGVGVAVAMMGASVLADVTASFGASNLYMWRGLDWGEGDALISGSLDVSMSGFYAGTWVASFDNSINNGDGTASAGQEIDLYAGYAFGDDTFGLDIMAINYMYTGDDDYDTFGQYAEVHVNATFDMFTLTAVKVVAEEAPDTPATADSSSFNDYWYYSAAVEIDGFKVLVGHADQGLESMNAAGDDVDADYTHVDVSYTHSDIPGEWDDSLTFMLSKVVDQGVDSDEDFGSNATLDRIEDDPFLQVSYDVTFDL